MNRILIIGDVIHDTIVHLERTNKSIEEVPSYKEIYKETVTGGAANVAKHCSRLGAKVILFHTGEPVTFDELTISEQLRIQQTWLSITSKTIKQRYYLGNEKLFKINHTPNMQVESYRIMGFLDLAVRRFNPNVIIACDNMHGTFSSETSKELVKYCKNNKIKLFVDAQLSQSIPDFKSWGGATSIFVNLTEARQMTWDDAKFESMHIKLGPEGSEIITPLDSVKPDEKQKGFEVKVIDTLGAGDAYLAAWAVTENLEAANKWASLACTTFSTNLPEKDEQFNEIIIRLSKSK